jgi:hypothetical protein
LVEVLGVDQVVQAGVGSHRQPVELVAQVGGPSASLTAHLLGPFAGRSIP